MNIEIQNVSSKTKDPFIGFSEDGFFNTRFDGNWISGFYDVSEIETLSDEDKEHYLETTVKEEIKDLYIKEHRKVFIRLELGPMRDILADLNDNQDFKQIFESIESQAKKNYQKGRKTAICLKLGDWRRVGAKVGELWEKTAKVLKDEIDLIDSLTFLEQTDFEKLKEYSEDEINPFLSEVIKLSF